MKRMRIDGFPVLLFTTRLSPRRWEYSTLLERDADGCRWSVTLSPKSRRGDASEVIPVARVHVERADGRVEGVWRSASSKARWTYARTVNLNGSEPLPSLVVHESLLPRRLALVRRRLPGAT